MELEKFVSETIKEIVSGVKQAQEEVVELNGKVNPYTRSADTIQNVDFDVKISTSDETATEGGIGIFVGPVSVGSRGESENKEKSVGTISFSIPVELPEQDSN
jgi:hypothetical protein